MDEKYIRQRVTQVYSQSYGGGMIDKFTALIVELLNEQAAQQSVRADLPSESVCKECFGYGGFHSDNCSRIAASR